MNRKPMTKGAEEARAHLPELLDAAERGLATIITRRGKPVATLVPMSDYRLKQASLAPLIGAMKGYWGEDSRRAINELKDEWER